MSGREECMAVSLSGGGPWGFRLQGGAGTGMPLTVHKVRRKSKAYRRLREGDRIVSVNGRPCDGLTYEQLMDIADNSHADLHLQILRRECDKENEAPPSGKMPDNTKEVTISSQLQEKGGTSSKQEQLVEPFPLFSDLSTSSRQEVVSGDEKNLTKTITETRHEVKVPTEVTFVQESRSVDSPHSLPDITLDTIDLNNLISETQKRLDSFRHNFGALDTTLSTKEEAAIGEALRREGTSETKEKRQQEEQEVSKKNEAVKKIPKAKVEAFNDCLREMETDPLFSLPDIGIPSPPAETSTIPFGSDTTTLIKKKKMFSSSSFYEEPNSIYPTMEEQVEMARKIADSLADDTNKKSKGANMFYKRVKRSTKWIHEGPEPSDESGPGTPELERASKGLKLVLDPRHPLDLTALRSSGYVISEHNVVSPEVCHGLVKDLQSPVGKGAALFAKRKKKSEEWVVDEEKVKTLLREQKERQFHVPPLSTTPAYNQYSAPLRQDVKLVKSPWEAAMESPFGLCDAAFARVHPGQLADTVMKRADYIRSESLSREPSRMEGCVSPPQLADVYHAKAPRGWEGNFAPISSPAPQQHQPQNVFQPSKKMVFQNFNAVPRLWKGASVH